MWNTHREPVDRKIPRNHVGFPGAAAAAAGAIIAVGAPSTCARENRIIYYCAMLSVCASVRLVGRTRFTGPAVVHYYYIL